MVGFSVSQFWKSHKDRSSKGGTSLQKLKDRCLRSRKYRKPWSSDKSSILIVGVTVVIKHQVTIIQTVQKMVRVPRVSTLIEW